MHVHLTAGLRMQFWSPVVRPVIYWVKRYLRVATRTNAVSAESKKDGEDEWLSGA